jgi:hypothetical protein
MDSGYRYTTKENCCVSQSEGVLAFSPVLQSGLAFLTRRRNGNKSKRLDIREAAMSFTRRRGCFGLQSLPGVILAVLFQRDWNEKIEP